MPLNYLIFDTSDDGEGTGTWEAMASVSPGPRGPLDEGGAWDADQQVQAEGEWTTVTLTITGPWEWGEGLVGRFTPRD